MSDQNIFLTKLQKLRDYLFPAPGTRQTLSLLMPVILVIFSRIGSLEHLYKW